MGSHQTSLGKAEASPASTFSVNIGDYMKDEKKNPQSIQKENPSTSTEPELFDLSERPLRPDFDKLVEKYKRKTETKAGK